MHPTLEKLTTTREQLRTVVAGLSEETLDRPCGNGWTIRETITHLLNAEEDHCKVIVVVTRGESHRLPKRFSRDAHNQQRVTERGRLTGERLLHLLDEQRVRTLALFDRLGSEQMEMVADHPALGPIPIGKIFRTIALHERAHLREMQAAVKQYGANSR